MGSEMCIRDSRENGCIQYTVTRQVDHPFTTRTEYPIVFNEIWESAEALSAHCRRESIQHFFEAQVVSETGLVEHAIITAYTDEGHRFDAPIYSEE